MSVSTTGDGRGVCGGGDSRDIDDALCVTRGRRVAVFSWRARKWPHLRGFFPEAEIVPVELAARADVWCGWGATRQSRAVARAARSSGRTFLCVEDGFIRSVGLGKSGAPAISVVVDDLGLYLDAVSPSRIERLIATSHTPAWLDAGARIRGRITTARISKYNIGRTHSLEPRGSQPEDARRKRVILADQVYGDRSVVGALAGAHTFSRMLADARAASSHAEIVIRPHPDVTSGYRRGYLSAHETGFANTPDGLDAASVLDDCDEVWTVSSQLGFEALLRGIPVRTYGMPFYAGYGLTDDVAVGDAAVVARARRRGSLTGPAAIDALAAASFIRYPRYAHPDTGSPMFADDAIDFVDERRTSS